jgi:hypothetical protein
MDLVQESEIHGLVLEKDTNILDGFSGDKLVGTLQRLSRLYERDPNACYLEVGVFQGLTLLSVASSSPELSCYGIDNFAYLDPQGENMAIVEQRAKKLRISNKTLINADYEDALESLHEHLHNKKVGLYFIDGPHDYRSQFMCLELSLPYLHQNSVIVIDDCNYLHVRQANRDFLITHPEFKLIFEAYTKCHPKNMSSSDEAEARKGWWNGVNIIARDPQDLLCPMYPPTERSRLLYENEHELQSSRLAEVAPQVLEVANCFYGMKVIKSVKALVNLYKKVTHDKARYQHRFESLNTFSEGLTNGKYANYN